ncbi:MAG: hypothetical protein ACXVB9_21130 [Bdellovibrionota bacterium]
MRLSITRLKVARWGDLLKFLKASKACLAQAVADPQCLGVAIYVGPGAAFWATTLWKNEATMMAHLEAMSQLEEWCSDACSANLEVDSVAFPTRDELPGLLSRRAKFSPVKNPSPLQQGAIVSPGIPWLRQVAKTSRI